VVLDLAMGAAVQREPLQAARRFLILTYQHAG
jgi:hypothetical protein